MRYLEGFREGFGKGWRGVLQGWRESGISPRYRWIPVAAMLLGGAVAIYALVRRGQ